MRQRGFLLTPGGLYWIIIYCKFKVSGEWKLAISAKSLRKAVGLTNIKEKIMAKKLYVGGLPYATRDEELKEAFSQAGTVASATVIIDRMSGRSKGFGFVEYASDEEAQKAIEMFDGTDLGGRTIKVNEARPMEERPRRDRGSDFGKSW